MGVLAAVRRFLAIILLIGMGGTIVELLLIGHDEEAIQLVPLVLLGLGLVALGWHALRPGPASVRAFRVLMLGFVAAGFAGVYFHFRANVEFQRESNPSISGVDLVMQVLEAKVPPTLAPGVMLQLGLLGLAYTYRYKETS